MVLLFVVPILLEPITEHYVFSKLEEITSNDSILKSLVDNVNTRISSIKEPIKTQYEITLEEIKKVRPF